MKIKHKPMFDIEKVEKIYSEKDGVAVKYVMTSELPNMYKAVDIFYRETPHPEFGNRYFGIFEGAYELTYIINADAIDGVNVHAVEDENGELQYSATRHDYKWFGNGSMIDGGRECPRYSGKVHLLQVINGELK
jgi:hypothetical protein